MGGCALPPNMSQLTGLLRNYDDARHNVTQHVVECCGVLWACCGMLWRVVGMLWNVVACCGMLWACCGMLSVQGRVVITFGRFKSINSLRFCLSNAILSNAVLSNEVLSNAILSNEILSN